MTETCLPCRIGDHAECENRDEEANLVSDGYGHTIIDCCDGHFQGVADRRAGI